MRLLIGGAVAWWGGMRKVVTSSWSSGIEGTAGSSPSLPVRSAVDDEW